MAAPVVDAFTREVYDSLPEAVRTGQDALDYPLLRYLSLVLDQIGAQVTTAEAIDYTPVDEGGAPGDVSKLVDPDTADHAWLPWLAQLAGIQLDPALSDADARTAIRSGSAGWMAGTRQAIIDAAKTALTGSRYVELIGHETSDGAGGPWDLAVVTRPYETPNGQAVLDAINAQHAKPAGVVIWHKTYGASWQTLHTLRPTWADWNTATWDDIHQTGSASA